VGGIVMTWAMAANRRESLVRSGQFVAGLAAPMAASAVFSSLVLHARSAGAFYLYPLNSNFHWLERDEPAKVWAGFRNTPWVALIAIRMHNLMLFLFPSDPAEVVLRIHIEEIWDAVKWKWYRIYHGASLWGATGLLTFPLAVWGIVQTWADRRMRLLAIAFLMIPSALYVLWMGYLLDYNGYTTCQPLVAVALCFAGIALGGRSERTAMILGTVMAVEMIFALSIAYHDLAVSALMVAAAMAGVAAIGPGSGSREAGVDEQLSRNASLMS